MVPTVWPLTDPTALRASSAPDAAATYRLLRRGPLSTVGQAVAVLRSTPAAAGPDLQLAMAVTGLDAGGPPAELEAMVCLVALLAPASRGSVRLSGAGPDDAPVVDPSYLSHPEDRARLRHGVRQLCALYATPPLAELTGPAPLGLGTDPDDQEVEAFITAQATSYWHPVGTARLGTGPMGVLDPATMGVRGTTNLFAADASSIPTITRGNTQAPVIAIAERASHLIPQGGSGLTALRPVTAHRTRWDAASSLTWIVGDEPVTSGLVRRNITPGAGVTVTRSAGPWPPDRGG